MTGKLFHIGDVVRATIATQASIMDSRGQWNDENLSPAEVNIAAALLEAGIEFEQQTRFGPYSVDFWFPEARLIVEIDGKHHHRDLERDRRRARRLLELGAKRVIHIAAATTWKDPDGCIRAIRYYLDDRTDA